MNEVIRQLNERKSVRVFTGQGVAPAEKTAILQAAVAAPTAGNQQLYTILDITDRALKEKLAELCDHQPFIAKADMVLIFCADCQKWQDAYLAADCHPRDPGVGDLMLAVQDAALAAQNAVTAAWSLGIGSCYIGDIMENCEQQRTLLQLPDYVFPALMLVFGRPTAQQEARPKPERMAMRQIVHENAYRRADAAEREAALAARAGSVGTAAWLQAFCNRKYNSGFAKEMTRSVAEYLKPFEKK